MNAENFKSLIELVNAFPTEQSCIDYLESRRWNGNVVSHTNTIEGFGSILKRGIIGIYHFTSRKHLQRYVDEFAFRYNTRKTVDSDRFNLLLHRLTYKSLTYG